MKLRSPEDSKSAIETPTYGSSINLKYTDKVRSIQCNANLKKFKYLQQ